MGLQWDSGILETGSYKGVTPNVYTKKEEKQLHSLISEIINNPDENNQQKIKRLNSITHKGQLRAVLLKKIKNEK